MTEQEFESLKYWDKSTLDYKNELLFSEDVIKNTDFNLMIFFEQMQYHIKRIYPNAVMIFHCLYEPRSTGGQHPLGLAGDFHLEEHMPDGQIQALYPDFKRDIEFIEVILEKMGALDQVAWGIYPHWAHPGHHLDIRSINLGPKEGGWRWGQIWDNSKQKMQYVTFGEAYQKAGATFE